MLVILGIYVDDIVLLSNNLSDLEQSKAELAREFSMTNGGKSLIF